MAKSSILLVDDDRDMVDSFSRWFKRKGYRTTSTYHPMQCLIAAANQKFDVAVIDIGLPDMNGLELLGELIQLERFPVLVLSGISDPKIQSNAIELGADRFLVKPVSMELLERAIGDAISQSHFSSLPVGVGPRHSGSQHGGPTNGQT